MIKRGQNAGRKNPYKHGYLLKIAYHMAANNPEKVAYFFNRQVQVYGPITPENMAFIAKETNKTQRAWALEINEFRSHLG